jgi:hypothetical protein
VEENKDVIINKVLINKWNITWMTIIFAIGLHLVAFYAGGLVGWLIVTLSFLTAYVIEYRNKTGITNKGHLVVLGVLYLIFVILPIL